MLSYLVTCSHPTIGNRPVGSRKAQMSGSAVIDALSSTFGPILGDGCIFVMGSRARGEECPSSDIEFGIILPSSMDKEAFRARMPSKEDFESSLAPIELDTARHPWGKYLGTVEDLYDVFSAVQTDEVNGFMFIDSICVLGTSTLLQQLRTKCHTRLPLPHFVFNTNLLLDILPNLRLCQQNWPDRYSDYLKNVYQEGYLLVRYLYTRVSGEKTAVSSNDRLDFLSNLPNANKQLVWAMRILVQRCVLLRRGKQYTLDDEIILTALVHLINNAFLTP